MAHVIMTKVLLYFVQDKDDKQNEQMKQQLKHIN